MTAGSTELLAIPNSQGSGTTYFSLVYWSATTKGTKRNKTTKTDTK
jgi:hypothetical protein